MAEQSRVPLSESDRERLDEQRAVVTRYLAEESRSDYETAAGKLGLLRALLNAQTFAPDQTYELQSMGIVFGDALVQDVGFHWIIVEDEYGRDPALKFEETSVILFPLTMISKRVERGEEVDVFELYNGVAGLARDKIEEERSRGQ